MNSPANFVGFDFFQTLQNQIHLKFVNEKLWHKVYWCKSTRRLKSVLLIQMFKCFAFFKPLVIWKKLWSTTYYAISTCLEGFLSESRLSWAIERKKSLEVKQWQSFMLPRVFSNSCLIWPHRLSLSGSRLLPWQLELIFGLWLDGDGYTIFIVLFLVGPVLINPDDKLRLISYFWLQV